MVSTNIESRVLKEGYLVSFPFKKRKCQVLPFGEVLGALTGVASLEEIVHWGKTLGVSSCSGTSVPHSTLPPAGRHPLDPAYLLPAMWYADSGTNTCSHYDVPHHHRPRIYTVREYGLKPGETMS